MYDFILYFISTVLPFLIVKFLIIYVYPFLVCLFGTDTRLNGWTDPTHIFVATQMIPGKVYEWLELEKFGLEKLRFFKIHEKNR